MRRTGLIVALLIVLPLATFGRVLSHGFVNWDDHAQLYENPDFNPPTPAKIARYWRGPHMNLYLPVTYTLWGALSSVARLERPDASGAMLDARYFHAMNLLLHIASTLLVFAILRSLQVADVPAALGALAFALHPVMVEPVAWASATYTVLSGMFSLLAIWQYLQFARLDAEQSDDVREGLVAPYASAEGSASVGRTAARNSKWTAFAIGTTALVLAMLSKPSAVVVPVIAAALDVLLVRKSGRRARPAAIAWLLVALPIMILAKRFQPAAWVEAVPLWQRPMVAADAIAFYLGHVAWPWKLGADYGRSPQHIMAHGSPLVACIVVAVVAALAWGLRRRAPWVAAALVVFVAGMGTYLGAATFDFQYWSTVADRYLYLSMLAIATVVAFGLSAVPRRRRTAASAVAAGIIALLAARSAMQTGVWRDTRTLFEHALTVNPDSVIAHNNLGYLAAQERRVEVAMEHYRAALRAKPRNDSANFNLANALLARGEIDAAIPHYRVAAEAHRPSPLVYNNLGVALARAGRLDEAEQAFAAALRINPGLEMARQGLQRVRQEIAAAAASMPATSQSAPQP